MKRCISFLIAFAMLLSMIPAVFADDTSVTLVAADLGLANAEEFTGTTIGPISFAAALIAESGTTPKYYDSGSAIRLYKDNSLTITPDVGYTITSIVVESASSGYNMEAAGVELTNATRDGETVTPVDGTQPVVITNDPANKTQLRITSITVYYDVVSTTPDPSEPAPSEPDPTEPAPVDPPPTDNELACPSFWSAHSGGFEVTQAGVEITFTNTTYESADANWHSAMYVLYTADEPVVNGGGYSEYWVQRADAYGWGTGTWVTDSAPADWAAWVESLKTGVAGKITAKLEGENAIIVMELGEAVSTATVPVDTSKPVYLSLSGEMTTLSNIVATFGEPEPPATDAVLSGTIEAVAGETYTTESWTASADGLLTIDLSAAEGLGYNVYCNGQALFLGYELTYSASVSYNVVAGDTYYVEIIGRNPDTWGNCNATVAYSFHFEAGAVAKEDYIISEQKVEKPGTYTIDMIPNAVVTIIAVTPDAAGYYTITAPEGTLIANMGSGSWFIIPWSDVTPGTSLEWVCEEAGYWTQVEILDENDQPIVIDDYIEGQSLMLGILSDSASVEITVTKTGDIDTAPEITVEKYTNKHTPVDYVLPEGAVIGEYINIYDTVSHSAVLGDDGFYHLDSADGPILLVDLDHMDYPLDSFRNDPMARQEMIASVTESGKVVALYDILAAYDAYAAAADVNGYYPLTEDLMFFYQYYAINTISLTHWLFEDHSFNLDHAWMFACLTLELPDAPPAAGSEHHFDSLVDVTPGADKEAIEEGTTFADGFFTVIGTVTQRFSESKGGVYAIEIGKNLSGGIEFTVSGTAEITFEVSSTGSSNTSVVAIVDANGKEVFRTEVTGTNATEFTCTLEPGTYSFVSPESDYNRGYRLMTIDVVIQGAGEPPVEPGEEHHFDSLVDVTPGADKEAIPEGTTFADGFFTVIGTVTQRFSESKGGVYAIEIGKNLSGAIEFTLSGTAEITFEVSSTGSSNTSVVAIVDANGKEVFRAEVTGTNATEFTCTLEPGTYSFVSPESDYNRGYRLMTIDVAVVASEPPVEPGNNFTLGDNSLEISREECEAGNNVYTATYTATYTGKLYAAITMFQMDEGNGWVDYSTEPGSYYGWAFTLTVNGQELSGSYYGAIDVVEGETYTFVWEADGWWDYGNKATLNLSKTDENIPKPGSALLPIEVTMDDLPLETVEIAAGGSAYYSLYFTGAIITVTGENVYVVYEAYNEETYMMEEHIAYPVDGVITITDSPAMIQICNTGSTAATFKLDAAYPLGSRLNPDELVEGDNKHEFAEGDDSAYFYTWTATVDGTIILTMSGENWGVSVYNMSSGEAVTLSASGAVNVLEMDVAVGHELQISVYSEGYEGEDGMVFPAASVNVNLAIPCDHKYGEGTHHDAACGVDAYTEYTCELCGHVHTEVEEGTALDHSYVDGVCEHCGAPMYKLGDVNGDGKINVLDAGLIVSYYTGVKALDDTQKLAADVNGDGKINVLDAGLIVSFYTGVITIFPAENP